MSLLDRFNRNLAAGPPPGQPASVLRTPVEPLPVRPRPHLAVPAAPPPQTPTGQGVAAPARPAGPPSAPSPAHGAPPATLRQASPLMTRTGLQRASGAKSSALQAQYVQLRARVHEQLVEELVDTEGTSEEQIIAKLAELVGKVAAEVNLTLTRQDRQRLVEALTNDVLGLGPLEGLLADPDVTEVMINGPRHVYVEKHGRITLSSTTFESNDQLMQVIDRIVSTIGRRVDESSPMVDARLKDGSRVNVIIPPLALSGPTVTIRKFSKDPFQVADLERFGTVTPDMVEFLGQCVRARMNIIVSGGTGSGKTTTLNILSGFIPDDERIVTIEDAAELQLRQEHVVTLETRPANVEGRGAVGIRELVINSLRMRPDRIVVGECRGGEALDMLQAMNTGHDGSLTTAHANSPTDCLSRLETMVLMAGADLPSRAIREQIAAAVNVVVQQSRMRDGTRKITNIAEVLAFDGERVKVQDIFVYKQVGVDEEGNVLGQHMPTGVVPSFVDQLRASGEKVDESIFHTPRPAVVGAQA